MTDDEKRRRAQRVMNAMAELRDAVESAREADLHVHLTGNLFQLIEPGDTQITELRVWPAGDAIPPRRTP